MGRESWRFAAPPAGQGRCEAPTFASSITQRRTQNVPNAERPVRHSAQQISAVFVRSSQGNLADCPVGCSAMEVALTLISIASFFALVVSWAVLPTGERVA